MILVNIQYFFVVLRVNDLLRYLISFVSLCTLRANTNVSSYLNDLLARSILQCGRILNDVVLVRGSWNQISTPGPWLLRISEVRFSLVRIFKK